MRAAPLPTPSRYLSHASPALTDSCLSSSGRAITRCPSSTGRGLSKTLGFCVSKTSFDVLRGLRDPERLSFEVMHRLRVVYGSGTVRWSVPFFNTTKSRSRNVSASCHS